MSHAKRVGGLRDRGFLPSSGRLIALAAIRLSLQGARDYTYNYPFKACSAGIVQIHQCHEGSLKSVEYAQGHHILRTSHSGASVDYKHQTNTRPNSYHLLTISIPKPLALVLISPRDSVLFRPEIVGDGVP